MPFDAHLAAFRSTKSGQLNAIRCPSGRILTYAKPEGEAQRSPTHCFQLINKKVSDAPDREGEHPVLYIDIDDMPELGAYYAGLDLYLGWAAGLLAEPDGRWIT
jgi:hypothetical protein